MTSEFNTFSCKLLQFLAFVSKPVGNDLCGHFLTFCQRSPSWQTQTHRHTWTQAVWLSSHVHTSTVNTCSHHCCDLQCWTGASLVMCYSQHY